MRYGRYGWSHIMLSWGLGITFLWIGIDILRHAENWIGFIPATLPFGLGRELTLQMSGLFDIVIGGLFLLRWFSRLTAFLAALHLISILVTQRIDAVLIRDVGLLGATLALFTWPQHGHRRSWWRRMFKRRSSAPVEEE